MTTFDARLASLTQVVDGPLAQRTVRALRRVAKQIVWQLRGLTITNPEVPRQVRSVLFVCLGNICRSPFAEKRADAVARALGVAIRFASAGLRPSTDGRCPDDAVSAARRFEVSLIDHSPIALDAALIVEHDLIVVMEATQLSALRAKWPQYRSRFFLLPLFESQSVGGLDAYERLNIPDPFGRGPDAFERCYRRLDGAVRDLIAQSSARAPQAGRTSGHSERSQ
jgi:protein-tyrosine phosphatase